MLAASETTVPGALPGDTAMPGQPAIETVEKPSQGFNPSIEALNAARREPTPNAMMELVEKMTLKDIHDNLLKFTGTSFSSLIKRNAAPMLAILMYQNVVPMPQGGASDETQRPAQETQDQATEAAESIIRAAHKNAATIEAAAQARIAGTEIEILATRAAQQQAEEKREQAATVEALAQKNAERVALLERQMSVMMALPP